MHASALAIVAGVTFLPAVVGLKALGYLLIEKANAASGEEKCRNKTTASS